MCYRTSGVEKTLPVMAFAKRGQRGGSGGQMMRCWKWKDEIRERMLLKSLDCIS